LNHNLICHSIQYAGEQQGATAKSSRFLLRSLSTAATNGTN